MDTADTAPQWFHRAMDVPPSEGWVDVRGCRIHYLAWGEVDRPGLVLVHGGGAHAHWWCHVAPMLTQGLRVLALDLSGHGDSGRREQYPLDVWADEIVAVARHGGIAGKPVVVGHSMGGFVTIATAAFRPHDLEAIVILDSPVTREDPEVEAARIGHAFRPPRPYADRAEALARFRTVPAQDHYLPYVLQHVAEHSLVESPEGWTWKFDAAVFRARRNEVAQLLGDVRCRVALFSAEHGLMTPSVGDYMYERLGRTAPLVVIPEAGHHMMLDQPLLLLTALRTLLADWEHSIPRRRR